MNSEWSLDVLYKGFDDPKFQEDFQKIDEICEKVNSFAAGLPGGDAKENLLTYLDLQEQIAGMIYSLGIYANLRQSVNTSDSESVSYLGRLMGKMASTTKAGTIAKKYIASLENLDELIESDPLLKEYEYLLNQIKDDAKYTLSDEAEEVIAKFNISGGSGWSDLQSYLTSSVQADYRGEKITLSAVRNLAYDADEKVRKDAYEAELACYDKIKDSVAFSLNNIKLQVINEAQMRGFASPLDETLYNSRLQRETLEALMESIEEYLPLFRSYLKAKAVYLGHHDGLPWYDLFAPVGSSDGQKFTAEEARDYLVNLFGGFDQDLADMIARAFDEEWIDFYPREGKVGGAFCAGLPLQKQSRILTNFDGSFSAVDTLAHELGHAYHNLNIEDHRILNSDYTMPVAETASTFNENVVMSAAVESVTEPEARLALLESQLMEVTQVICDIYSRYLFETAVFARRDGEFMFADELCKMMLDAQKKAYGDGLNKDVMHPYMWVCKGHYYSTGNSFYNFPYAFGGLLARGLYAKYKEEGKSFVPKYREMLHATPVTSCEGAAAIAGIDLTKKEFWQMSLKSYEKEIAEYIELSKRLRK